MVSVWFFWLPAAQHYHGVGFHDAFDSADFFYAFVDFCYVHSADDGDDVVFACDFVDGFYVWDGLDSFC